MYPLYTLTHIIYIIETSKPHGDLVPHINQARDNILAHLITVLHGDAIAAEYILLYMLSR